MQHQNLAFHINQHQQYLDQKKEEEAAFLQAFLHPSFFLVVVSYLLEKFSFLSKGKNCLKEDGTSAYYRDVINNESEYLWVGNKLAENWDADVSSTTSFTTLTNSRNMDYKDRLNQRAKLVPGVRIPSAVVTASPSLPTDIAIRLD